MYVTMFGVSTFKCPAMSFSGYEYINLLYFQVTLCVDKKLVNYRVNRLNETKTRGFLWFKI